MGRPPYKSTEERDGRSFECSAFNVLMYILYLQVVQMGLSI